MSVYYSKKRKGWRYEFIVKKIRYTGTWYKTKQETREAEYKRKEELKNPKQEVTIPIDMDFLTLVNKRLDHVRAYHSKAHYRYYVYNAKKWIKRWSDLMCDKITLDMVQDYIHERRKVSPYAANQDLRHLRATFNYGKKMGYINFNPTYGVDFFPVEKKIKYIPSAEDINKLIACADSEIQDYLWIIRDTIARVSEINNLIWDDVNLETKSITLYTRKKKGGHLTPRIVPMTQKIFEILTKRNEVRDKTKPWVFWHEYKSRNTGKVVVGPYEDRKCLMRKLCKKANIRYFRYHALRHAGASVMDNNNVPIMAIQEILGHESRVTTEIYLHGLNQLVRTAMDVYERTR